MGHYVFELLAIDKDGQTEITKADSLYKGLLFSESLWKNAKEIVTGETKKIVDDELKIELKFQTVDTSKALNDLIESAFIIKITGKDFDSIEKFRYSFLIHLKGRLKFSNIRILHDDVSTEISNEIYPLVNKIENLLRRYLIKFFTQKIGVDWWTVTASRLLTDKMSSRKGNEKVFSQLVDTDVTLIDFDDLGELIYKQSSGFNTQENIIKRIMETKSLEGLESLKQELQGNYSKYFKTAFQDNQFDKKWKKLFEIRNKVAHNNLFVCDDLNNAKQLVTDLTKIINEAEEKIEEFKFSVEEQEAIRQVTIDAVKAEEAQTTSQEKEKLTELKIIGKIDLSDIGKQDENDNSSGMFKIISEEQFLEELKKSEDWAKRNSNFVGLKYFVTKILGSKGYAFGPAYSLVNILREKNLVELYEVNDPYSLFPTKAIRRK